MKKVTDTLSKEIVSVCEGEIAGIVTNVYTDGKLERVRGYKVSSEDRDEGRFLPLRRLIAEGDAMIVCGKYALEETSLSECPLGSKVFDTAGAFCGVLRDLLFDEETGRVLSLVADEKEIDPMRVIRFGKNAVVLRAPCHDGKVFRRSAKSRSRKKKDSVPALPAVSSKTIAEPPLPIESEGTPVETVSLEERDIFPLQDYAFLLGRIVLKRIGEGADLVASENEIVTTDIILNAREKGKLVELTVNSRK